MASITFNEERLRDAIRKHGEKVVKKFSADTFKTIVKTSPQKDTFKKPNGKYRRTGTLRDGWDIKKKLKGYEILNETFYAPYFEYGHRLRNGNIQKGAYLMSNAVEKMLKKYNLKAQRKTDL